MSVLYSSVALQSQLPRAIFTLANATGSSYANFAPDTNNQVFFTPSLWKAKSNAFVNNITLGTNSSFTVSVSGLYNLQMSLCVMNGSVTGNITGSWVSTQIGPLNVTSVPANSNNQWFSFGYTGPLVAGDVITPRVTGVSSSQGYYLYYETTFSIACTAKIA
jgi:hypothetical protein